MNETALTHLLNEMTRLRVELDLERAERIRLSQLINDIKQDLDGMDKLLAQIQAPDAYDDRRRSKLNG